MTTDVTIKMDPIALREATSQAIMGLLTPEMRAEILQTSISAILRPSTDRWGKGKSPLEEAFELAVSNIAHEEARKMVAEDADIRAKLADLLKQTADKLLDCDLDKLTDRMSDALVSSLKRDY